jgi:hypothetical protein
VRLLFAFPAAPLLLVLALACAACAPKAGDRCKPGEKRCAARASALVCVDGTFASIPCGGPEGCAISSKRDLVCDNAIATIGDSCADDGDTACSADKRALLACKGRRFVASSPCRGARGCEISGDQVICDVGLAELGEACKREENHACSVDRSAMLVCRGGAFRLASHCRGARGCVASASHVDCDDALTDAAP